jgi:hypothetical protein
MKFSIIVAVTVSLSARLVSASPTEVSPLPTPTTIIEKQSRTSLKHRKRPLLYHVFLAEVSDIIALNQQLPAGVKNASIRKQNVPISPIEREVYTIDGDLWRVKMEGNDNEYHLEISARGAGRTAKRIIVEVPPDPAYGATRRNLLSMLPGDYTFKQDMMRDLKQSIPIRVTGYAFFDAYHWSKKSIRGHNHGTALVATLWEIHPAWRVEPAH